MELDRLIQEKRTEIKEALSTYQKAGEAVVQIRNRLSELRIAAEPKGPGSGLEALRLAEAEMQQLEVAELNAATRFKAISDELTGLHRQKCGSWHITWTGPFVRP